MRDARITYARGSINSMESRARIIALFRVSANKKKRQKRERARERWKRGIEQKG